jgi:ABC-type uncharacterized transport system substrate-binding protein
LRQILPGVKPLGMLGDSNDPITRLDHQALAPIAASLGLTLVAAEAANPAEFEPAVARLIANRSEAIFPGSVLAYNFRGRLIELANESHVPVIGFVPSGRTAVLCSPTAPRWMTNTGLIRLPVGRDPFRVQKRQRLDCFF